MRRNCSPAREFAGRIVRHRRKLAASVSPRGRARLRAGCQISRALPRETQAKLHAINRIMLCAQKLRKIYPQEVDEAAKFLTKNQMPKINHPIAVK
jgi:hypothetical protein